MELTTEQLQSLGRYQALRDAARNAVQYGVYPQAKIALQAYAELEAALVNGLNEWSDTHAASTANVGPQIAALIAGLEQLVAGIEAVVALDPLVFPGLVQSE